VLFSFKAIGEIYMPTKRSSDSVVPLTDAFANDISIPGEWRDSKLPGFKLKVTPIGTKVWFVENLLKGTRKSLTITIGKHPAVNAKDARLQAGQLLDKLRRGIDPRLEQKRQMKQQEQEWEIDTQVQKLTFKFVLEDYLTRKTLKPNSILNYRYVTRGYLSDWMDRHLSDITKDDVEIRFADITNKKIGRRGKGGRGAANNTMRVVRALYKFANVVYEHSDGSKMITVNPVSRLSELGKWHKLKRRHTIVAKEDLPVWYQIWGQLENRVLADYLMFLLFTGLRKEEAARLKWSDVHGRQRYFEITDTKNKVDFALPITSRIREIFDRRVSGRTDSNNPYVFPNTPKGIQIDVREEHLEAFVKVGQIRFTLHDLRRTYLTQGYLLGYDFETLKRLANHKIKDLHDVTEGYLVVKVHDMREPMEKVADRLFDIMTSPVETFLDYPDQVHKANYRTSNTEAQISSEKPLQQSPLCKSERAM
jgi:integrase